MKFQPDRFATQSITGYGPGWLAVDGEKTSASIVLSSRGQRFDWQCRRFEDLGSAHFAQLAELGAEVVIFGSGPRLRFPHPALLRSLMAARIGVETMDTAAACRTYNVLAAEGRRVMAALLVHA